MKAIITQVSLIMGLVTALMVGNCVFAQQLNFSNNPLKEFATTQRVESQPTTPEIQVTVSGKLALCSHQERGHILLDIVGGTAPYRFLWNNNETVQNRYNLFAGTYTVTVTDSQNISVTQRIIVQPPFPFIVDLVEKVDATCATGNVGSAKVHVRFGRGEPYKVKWSHGLEGSMEANNLRPGSYHVTISDLYNCEMTVSFAIQGDPEGMKITEKLEQPSCDNGQKGAISLEVSGGKAPYSFLWSNGSTARELKNLDQGTYVVLVKDANGCTYQQEFAIEAGEALEIEALKVIDNFCAAGQDGEIEVSISGGKAPYQIRWNNGQQTAAIKNLSAGVFTIEAIDAEGCKVSKSFEIKAPELLQAKLESSVEMNCETGRALGYAWVEIAGGIAPYNIQWSNGNSNTREITFTQSEDLTVQITDVNGCTVQAKIKVDLPYYGELGRLDFEYRKLEISSEDEVFIAEPLQFISFISPDFIAWEWEFGDGTTSTEKDPIHIYKQAGVYSVTLRAFDMYGCSATQIHEVLVLKANEWVTIPSAFTPNGDGLNDFFKPVANGISKFEMSIFNNWGEELFRTSAIESAGWDGTHRGRLLPRGNYMYRISMITLTGEVIQKSGSITLIR
ncbi:T9SS type B sorting domain-containing protein [Mongoliitalea daihaiensis]|uniref:T9SS type B sorting domain-containing protein n=1 Tax=Mongoliitalea daihaiensis TaxID=2782006 RepID=UPI001F3CEE83|nr:gliding motility-associated C-terminal domain-containing protein [Mongoliitalea daihaiensis]UJP65736.1 gliding motility-associated C-terminal domain-containing protein [Mongoliitalea daihaiensis]